jgi:hypothetical protein
VVSIVLRTHLHISLEELWDITKSYSGLVLKMASLAMGVTHAAKLLGLIFCFAIVLIDFDRLCGLVVRVPDYRTEMYCASCEVRIDFVYVM